MSENHEFLAHVLRRAPQALAGYAAQALIEQHPEAQQVFAPDSFAGWQNWLALRLEELAAAASTRRPAIMAAQVRWSRALLAERGIASESLRLSLIHI